MHPGEFRPPVLATAVYLAFYWRRARTLSRHGWPIATWRVISFVGGALAVAVVQLPPFDTLADQVLVAHMAQHIMIGTLPRC
jgi:cytochrome c oxidase assembly factor CtaG